MKKGLLDSAITAAVQDQLSEDGSIRRGVSFDHGFALHEPEIYFKFKKEEAEQLGIAPPDSSKLMDLLEYENRASQRREVFSPGEERKPGPWGI